MQEFEFEYRDMDGARSMDYVNARDMKHARALAKELIGYGAVLLVVRISERVKK